MAQVINNFFGGGNKPAAKPIPSADPDFADFAEVPDPSPASPVLNQPTLGGTAAQATGSPSKWYAIHERHSLSEFKSEGIILGLLSFFMLLHLFGARLNRNKARSWMRAHAKPLTSEFAIVGFEGVPAPLADKEGDELLQELVRSNEATPPERLLKEKSLFEFATYATGRQNVAFVDLDLTLVKRFNMLSAISEWVISFFFESAKAPEDSFEAVSYTFDGKEAWTVPGLPGAAELKTKDSKSSYDGFVWALVNKDRMKQLREERYDISTTFTKDNAKLPVWLTVMSESAEITETLLTPELIKAAHSAGDLLDHLIVTDQPLDKPKTVAETTPRKRIYLKYRLPSNNNYEPLIPIFNYFLRLPDSLAQSAKFRPEVLRKLKAGREEVIKQILKASEEEKAEERAAEREKQRKAKRDAELAALDSKAQKKYLDKEREKELRKSMKKNTTRG